MSAQATTAIAQLPVLEYAETTRRSGMGGWFAYCIGCNWYWAASEESVLKRLAAQYRLVRNDNLKVPSFDRLHSEEDAGF